MDNQEQDQGKAAQARTSGEAPLQNTGALEASPASLLRAMRGSIVAAKVGHPGVLHVEIRDSQQGVWRLASQDARWLPGEPQALVGLGVEDAEIDLAGGRLRCKLSDGASIEIKESGEEPVGDSPAWELITPAGLALEFGPGLRWAISNARARPGAQ